MLVFDGIVIGALTGAIVCGAGGIVIALNSTGGKADIPNAILYGAAGGAIGGVLGDIVTLNSMGGIITGATIGAGFGFSLLILQELSTIG